ncbi:MAG: hypothetical protein IPI49_28155 [Myxococcales bacterium]|nr:hypothetical protein [Myxococcales bacterium]HRC58366.1 hypothetical protein [Kofleriaceae bacterium]
MTPVSAGSEVATPPGRPLPVTSIVLCLVAATLLAAVCMSKRWLANGNDQVTVSYGLIRNTECREGRCLTRPNSELPVLLQTHPPEAISPAFVPAGMATLGASALAIVCLVICALLALGRSRLQLPISPASLALLGLLVAIVAGSVFIATKPGMRNRVGVDWSFVVFGVAVVTGIAAAQRISAELRQDDLEEDSY